MTDLEFAIRATLGWAWGHAGTWWALTVYLILLTAISWAGRNALTDASRTVDAILAGRDQRDERDDDGRGTS